MMFGTIVAPQGKTKDCVFCKQWGADRTDGRFYVPVPGAAVHQKGYKKELQNIFKTVVLDALEGKMDSCLLRHPTCWCRILLSPTQPSKPAAPRPASTRLLYILLMGSSNKANTRRAQQKVLILCTSVSDTFGLKHFIEKISCKRHC